jgi:hypothetical protein
MAMSGVSGDELIRRRAEGRCVTCGWSKVERGRDGELEYQCAGCKKNEREAKEQARKK